MRPTTRLKRKIDAAADSRTDLEKIDFAINHYAIEEVRISKSHPKRVLDISSPILYSIEPDEFSGTLGANKPFHVVFFNQSLFFHNNHWYLYYGGADPVVCLAGGK